MKSSTEGPGMYDDEMLLSFGDDTIAAINHLEISRLVNNLTQKADANLKNNSFSLSPRQDIQVYLSRASVKNSVIDKNEKSILSVSADKSSPSLCTQQKRDLAMWGLPEPVLQQYEARGIKTMFPWQVECLIDEEVLSGRNLVYSAPTSAGKTLVAELLTIKTVLEKKKKAVIILPFVSVVREKMFYFKSLLETSGVRVEGMMGGHTVQGGLKNLDIAVCTIEKANSLINRLMEEGALHNLGIIVVDELHLLGDPFRGYLLELLITKIRYMSTINEEVNVQIVGMSATLPNLNLLATWLDAHLYYTDFRPIPLNEYLKVGPEVYDKNLEMKRIVESQFKLQEDPDHVIHLCLETIFNGHSALIFCPTKNWCEKLAINIAKEFFNIGNCNSDIGLKLRENLKSHAIAEALEQLKACPVGLDSALGKSVAFGVAFHHAGLTIDERDIIEGLFRSGVIRVLIATSTLSSGVNLPARRVIIRTPIFHRKPLDIQVYKQMVGRAGRMGKDTEGESFLLCHKAEQKIGEQLIQDDLKPITSCLGYGELSSSLKRAILEVIASGVAETPEKVQCYTKCTLLATSHTGLQDPIDSCISFLLENECIRLQLSEDKIKYIPTPLGNACLAASMSPDDGLELFQELQKARQCFVLENELHLVYLVTPYSVSAQWVNIDWLQVMSFWEKLAPSMRRVGNLVGVDEAFMVRALKGTLNLKNHKQLHKLSVHRRFYTALALQELVNEVPLVEVASKFQCSKGMLQSLQQTSATFAGMVTAFCKRLEWRNLELLVSQFQERLQFGVHRELCELMHLDILNGPRARALFNAGIKSLGDLASADICQVENALHKSVTFQTSKEMEGETSYDAAYRNQLRTIWITGKEGLTERDAAALLIKEARSWLQQELGLVNVKWGNDYDENTLNSEHELKDEIFSCENTTDCSETDNIDNDQNCGNVPEKQSQSFMCESEDEILDLSSECQTSQQVLNALETERGSTVCCPTFKFNLSEHLESNSSKEDIGENQSMSEVQGSESFDCKVMETSFSQKTRFSTPTKSPVDDIFEMSQDIDILNNGINCSENSLLISFQKDLAGPLEDTVLISSNKNNKDKLENISTRDDSHKILDVKEDEVSLSYTESKCEYVTSSRYGNSQKSSSKYSLDIFDSPVPTTCKSPAIFEDSLVIDSHLGNLLDESRTCNQESLTTCRRVNKDFEISHNLMPNGTSSEIIHKREKGSTSGDTSVHIEGHYSKLHNLTTELFPLDSLVIDSHLGNLLDETRSCNKEPLKINQKVKEVSESNQIFKSKGTNIEITHMREKSSESNDVSVHTADSLPNQHYSTSEILQEENKFCDNLGSKLMPIDNMPLCNRGNLQSGLINENVKKDEGNEIYVMQSDLTDSILREACTSICDFGNNCKVNNLQLAQNHTRVKVVHSLDKSNSLSHHSFKSKKEKMENFLEEKLPGVLYDVGSLKKQKMLPTENEYDITLNGKVKERSERESERDSFEETCSMKLFIDDSDSDEHDLVPSSQSQSDISFCPNSCSNKKLKEEDHVKKSLSLKRKRVKPKEILRSEKSNFDSGLKKLKFQSITSWNTFKIIDVCTNHKTFEEFKQKLKLCSHISFSVACEKSSEEIFKESIGDKILGRKYKKTETVKKLLVNDVCCVVGVAVCLGGTDAYYIALDTSCKARGSQGMVSFGEQLDLVESLMSHEADCFLSAFDIKEQYKALYHSCSVNIDNEVCDPKIAEWMLDADSDEKSLRLLMTKYLPNSLVLLKRVGNTGGRHSLGLSFKSSVRARIRASVEAVVTWHLINTQLKILEENGLLKVYKEVEMSTILCLAQMEISGIGFCRDEAENLQKRLQNLLTSLEQEAFKLACHSFSLSSTNDVSKVLFKELQLTACKFTSARKPSTSKEVLIKLKNQHPLPSIILEWRKINFIITNIILPFLKVGISDRIFGCYITHTATGRINMHEPNLQSIPRNFDISVLEGIKMTVSMREAFIPRSGNSFISADYSQLELRLLAHLSQDQTLLSILKGGTDVFKSVAASWKQIAEEEVTDDLRQKAKQVCYGVIYGIGANTLSDQLEIEEEEAAMFITTFLNAYPGLKKFCQDVKEECRVKGFVETLSGRKRFLPLINSNKPQIRAQAERQAVNTTVQGSAADIAKSGMVLVEASLKAAFRNKFPRIRRLRENKRQCIETKTAVLVLHLHDELIYEVCDEYLEETIHIIKGGMEAAANLTVPLPVRVKCGKSWGALKEVI